MKKIFSALIFVLIAILCLSSAAFAEEENEIALMSMSGGLSFTEFALYDESGATSARLLENHNMKATVTLANSRAAARNYYAVLAIYTDGGALSQCISQSGSLESYIDNPDSTGMKNLSFSFKIPKLTEETELKLMLFEAPSILAPNGSVYYTADKNGVYQCANGLKTDINTDVYYWEGVVTQTPMVQYERNGYRSTDTPKIRIDGYYITNDGGIEVKHSETLSAECGSIENIDSYFGKNVCAYITQKESGETGNYVLCDIREKRNKSVSMTNLQLVDADDYEYTVKGEIGYREKGSTKVRTLDLDRQVRLYANYCQHSINGYEFSTQDLEGYMGNGGRIELIDNDNDTEIEYILVSAWDAEGVVKSVSSADGIYSFKPYRGGLEDINTADSESLVRIYKDGALTDASAICGGDTVTTMEVSQNVHLLFASSEKVTGAVDSYDTEDGTVSVAGSEYSISPFFNKSPADLKDSEGIFYLNVNGEIAHVESTAVKNYGFVLAVDKETGINDGYVMQVALSDGTIAEYDVAARAKFYDKSGAVVTNNDQTTAQKIAALIGSGNLGASAVKATTEKAVNGVFDFEIKNGKITKIKSLQGDSINFLNANTKRYNAEAMSYGSAEFDKNTVVFAIDKKYGADAVSEIMDYDVKIGKVSDFFCDGDDALTFIALDEDGGICGAVVAFDMRRGIAEGSAPLVVTEVKTETYSGDDAVRVFGIRNGKEFSCIIYDSNADYESEVYPEDLRIGDVIMISAPDKNGVSGDFKTLYTSRTRTVDSSAAKGSAKDDVYNAAGNLDIDRTKASASKFYLDVDVENMGNVFATRDDGIAMKSSARYTLVDFTANSEFPQISAASSSAISTNRKYTSYIFVRVYNDSLSDVVVYRDNAGASADAVRKYISPAAAKYMNGEEYMLELIGSCGTDAYPINENCTVVGAGYVNQGAKAAYDYIGTVEGKNKDNVPIYEYTVTNDEITSVKAVSLNGSADSVSKADYSAAAYGFKDMALTKDTALIEIVCDEKGTAVSADCADIGKMLENECSAAWIESGGAVSAVVFFRNAETPVYSLLTAVDMSVGINDSYIIQAFMQNGAVREYELAQNVRVDGVKYVDKYAADKIKSFIGTTGNYPVRLTAANAANAIVSLSFNESGKVSAITTFGGSSLNYLDSNALKYSAASMTYGEAAFNEDTVLFAVRDYYSGSDEVRADNIKIGMVGDYLKNGRSYSIAAADKSGSVYRAAVVFGARIEPDSLSPVMTVFSTQECEYNGDSAVIVYGVRGGVKTSVIIYNKDDDFTSTIYPDELRGGDIIQLSDIKDNVASDFVTIYNGGLTENALGGDTENAVYNGFGNIASLNQGSITIDSAIMSGASEIVKAGAEIRLSPSAAVTVVGYVDGYKAEYVEALSSLSGVNAEKAYIRYKNGAAQDIVLFDTTRPETYVSYEHVSNADERRIETDYNSYGITESSVLLKDGKVIASGAEIARNITPYDEETVKISEIHGYVYKLTVDASDCLISIEQRQRAGSITNAPYDIITRSIGDISFGDSTQYIYAEYDNSRDELYNISRGFALENGANYDVDYFSENGEIVAAIVSRRLAPPNYGLVLAADKISGINDGYVMQVMLADGTSKVYELASNARFIDRNRNGVTGARNAAGAVASMFGGNVENNTVRPTYQSLANALFDFTFSNGKITRIKELTGDYISYLDVNTKRYDAESMTYGAAEFNDSTVVFAIDRKYDETAEIKDDDVKIGKISDFFHDGDDCLCFIALDEQKGICRAVIGFDIMESVPENSDAVIITGIRTVTYNDDDAVRITGIQGGNEVTYTIYNEDADYFSSVAPENLAKGDVILVGTPDGENVVSDFQTLYQADRTGALGTVDADAAKGDTKDSIYNAVANLDIDKTKASNGKFFLDADVKNYYRIFAPAVDGIGISSTANYTLADYTESVKNPGICKASPLTALSTSSKYKTVVFVRVYNDKLKEVVAYRFTTE